MTTSSSNSTTCDSCLKSPAPFECGLCNSSLCKKCAHFLNDDAFAFLSTPPEVAQHNCYCLSCFQQNIEPQIENYNQTLDKAKNMVVFFKGDGKDVRSLSLKRSEQTVKVEECADYHETVLRLAFMAAQKNFNVIVDVDAQSKKHHNGAYVTLTWSGKATPAHGDESRLRRYTQTMK